MTNNHFWTDGNSLANIYFNLYYTIDNILEEVYTRIEGTNTMVTRKVVCIIIIGTII